MKLKDIQEAINLAQEFITLAEMEIDRQVDLSNSESKYVDCRTSIRIGNLYGGKGAASIKRKSMDLTRQLSKMRNN